MNNDIIAAATALLQELAHTLPSELATIDAAGCLQLACIGAVSWLGAHAITRGELQR